MCAPGRGTRAVQVGGGPGRGCSPAKGGHSRALGEHSPRGGEGAQPGWNVSKRGTSLKEPGGQGMGAGERAGGLHTRSERSRHAHPQMPWFVERTCSSHRVVLSAVTYYSKRTRREKHVGETRHELSVSGRAWSPLR